ncbi:hypothetical protein ACN28C_15475 [Plantactinospora sp. WMMC1484]|uniref:hypothetical protein n=1 Tax=Plantactinospora sp. WMMC1484 TaxID=3404122 RepID=UPI003BF5A422
MRRERPPVVVEARPLPRPGDGPLVAAWSHPFTIAGVLLLVLLLIVLLVWALTRPGGPGEGAGPIAASSAGPSATGSPVAGPPTEALQTEPPATGAPASAAPPTGGGAPGAGSAAPGLPAFDDSDVDVLSNGTTRLELDSYGTQLDSPYGWQSADGYGGRPNGDGSELTFVGSGVVGREGTQLAVLGDGASRSFPTCQRHRAWSPALTWDQVYPGAFVCIKTPHGRRAMMRVDEMPDMTKSEPTVLVTGVTWEPVVDR